MRIERISAAIGVVLLLGATTVFAGQHDDHQSAPDIAPAVTSESCQGASRQAVEVLDGVSVRLEAARQTNNPAQMRAAFDEVQTALGSVKAQLSDCRASESGDEAAMPGMPGMDHSKMDHSQMAMAMTHAAAGSPHPEEAGASTGSAGVQITFKSEPAKLKLGQNRFDVTVTGADGKPITNAQVSVLFVMPAMPAMKMPDMKNEVKLQSAGSGHYSGSGQLTMAGEWTVTVNAVQRGKQIAQKKMKLTAQ